MTTEPYDAYVARIAANADPETNAELDRIAAAASIQNGRGPMSPGDVSEWSELLDIGIVRMDSVAPERIEWLWPGRIPRGKLTILEGDPKVGKSTLMLDIAARVTTGSPFPDGHRPAAGCVMILTAEDGLADTVRPRLDAAKADTQRVIAWESVPVLDDEGERTSDRPPSIPRDLGTLETLIVRHGVALVVIDVLNAYLGADVDGHKDQDVRRALMPLAKLAERTAAAVVVLRHLNKSTGGPAIYRGAGSIGIGGAARSILLASVNPEDESRRILASQGSNVAATPEALEYELVDTPEHGCARVGWLGVSLHTASTLLAAGSSEERDALTEACDILADLLSTGPMGARDVLRQSGDAGVSKRTLDRAKKHLGVESRKRGAGGWEWFLPDRTTDDSQPPQVGNLGNLSHDQRVQTAEDRQEVEDCQDRHGSGTGDLPTADQAELVLTATGATPKEEGNWDRF